MNAREMLARKNTMSKSFPRCKPHINSLRAFEPKLGAGMSNNDDSAGKLDKTAIRD